LGGHCEEPRGHEFFLALDAKLRWNLAGVVGRGKPPQPERAIAVEVREIAVAGSRPEVLSAQMKRLRRGTVTALPPQTSDLDLDSVIAAAMRHHGQQMPA
jgi:hypothetical protein